MDSSDALTGMIIEVRARGLRAMREKRGLTQQALANTLGISCSYVAALESGTVTPGGSLRRAFVAYFGCDLEELFQVEMVHLDEEGLAPESSG